MYSLYLIVIVSMSSFKTIPAELQVLEAVDELPPETQRKLKL